MQSAAFLALHCLAHNQITDIHHITQFTDFSGSDAAFEQALSLLVDNIQPIPGTFQAEVAADNTHVSTHNLIDFLHALRDEYHFFRRTGSLIVPFGNVFVVGIPVYDLQAMFGGCVGINNGFYQ